jgi:arylsulfate sulfotransferase
MPASFAPGHEQMTPQSRSFHLIGLAAVSLLLSACGTINEAPPPKINISTTENPLVARYSIASGCEGKAMVEFGTDMSYGHSTSWQPITGQYRRTDILVAGMRASTTYHMISHVQCFGNTFTSADQTFTTGPLPSTPFPSLVVSRPNPSLTPMENPGIELIDVFTIGPNVIKAFFTDRNGHPIWYYDLPQDQTPFTMKLLPNGNMIFSISALTAGTFLREVNLAGDTIRELNAVELAAKMQLAGFRFAPSGFHHDLLPLGNGHLIVLVDFAQNFTDLPGYPGTTGVIGDGLVDLDENWNPVWAWSAFDHLDVNRHLNGLPDWTHGNAVTYSPEDGNLLVSLRHQSWILKIDYNNGTGTGNVLWKLGYQGDFALSPIDDPSIWFSFQHFPVIVSQSGPETTLAIWDNGNARVMDTNGTLCTNGNAIGTPNACFSRAAVFQIDESTRVASLIWEDQPGNLSIWGGSINQLTNGNIEFDMNAPGFPPAPNVASEVQEVTQTSNPQVVWKMDILPIPTYAYRAYRVPSLYPGVTWQY